MLPIIEMPHGLSHSYKRNFSSLRNDYAAIIHSSISYELRQWQIAPYFRNSICRSVKWSCHSLETSQVRCNSTRYDLKDSQLTFSDSLYLTLLPARINIFGASNFSVQICIRQIHFLQELFSNT